MSTQITLTIPNDIYQQAEALAQSINRPVTEVLTESLRSAFPPLHTHQDRAAMQVEVAAFETMHPSLWEQYPHQYVAIYQGGVIDHDRDQIALVERMDEAYPGTVVLIRQVLPQRPPILHFRSPRFVKSS